MRLSLPRRSPPSPRETEGYCNLQAAEVYTTKKDRLVTTPALQLVQAVDRQRCRSQTFDDSGSSLLRDPPTMALELCAQIAGCSIGEGSKA